MKNNFFKDHCQMKQLHGVTGRLGGEPFPIQVNHGYLGGIILPCCIKNKAITRNKRCFHCLT